MHKNVSFDYDLLVRLAEKYSGNVPRYTSYPTAVEFSPEIGEPQWREALAQEFTTDDATAVSLYLHIPFCRHHCFFCACNKVFTQKPEDVERYLAALRKELALYASILPGSTSLEQIHWGGGTPNFLSPAQITAIHRYVLELFAPLRSDAEISMETDPRTLERDHLEALAELKFNRLSIGVQDFAPDVQQAINRVQPFEDTKAVCEAARALGVDNINFDLIYGLPLQRKETFEDTLSKVIELHPDRIALYGYAHVTWLKKSQTVLERYPLPTPEERIGLFALAVERLSAAGYCYIGLDHFALPGDSLTAALQSGKLNRTFMGYTTHRGSRLIACGSSSISILPRIMAQNTKDTESYCERLGAGSLPIERGVRRSREDRLRAELIESLLCGGRISISAFERKWGIVFFEMFADSIQKLETLAADNLITISKDEISLTQLGRLFARNAATAFDAYLAKKTARSFSQAV